MIKWLEQSHDWGYWINPDTFRTPRVKKNIRVGAVVFLKERETLDDGRTIIATNYGVAQESGIKDMGKKEVSKVLASQMVDYMRKKKMYPPKTKIKKEFANGNVDLDYSPTDYDSFIIRFTPELVGSDVTDFLYSLEKFKETEEEIPTTWKVEPAKSSRSTCRTCSQKIDKGELRLGEPSLYEGHVSYKWHHLKCMSHILKGIDLDSLEGYSDLTDLQKQDLQDA